MRALIGPAFIITFESHRYRYLNGVFYEPYNSGYRVIPPPPGVYVPSIPNGFQQVMVGDDTYYYYGGAFFVRNGTNYEVAAAPAGAVIYNLPEGAQQVTVDNYTYLQYNDTYYLPIQINGVDAYEVTYLEPYDQ